MVPFVPNWDPCSTSASTLYPLNHDNNMQIDFRDVPERFGEMTPVPTIQLMQAFLVRHCDALPNASPSPNALNWSLHHKAHPTLSCTCGLFFLEPGLAGGGDSRPVCHCVY